MNSELEARIVRKGHTKVANVLDAGAPKRFETGSSTRKMFLYYRKYSLPHQNYSLFPNLSMLL